MGAQAVSDFVGATPSMQLTGAVHVEVGRYGLDEVPAAYRRLHEGTVRGRAVVPGD